MHLTLYSKILLAVIMSYVLVLIYLQFAMTTDDG